MTNPQSIYTTNKEYQTYLRDLPKQNKENHIASFWSRILSEMPAQLRKEIEQLDIQLVVHSVGEFRMNHVKPVQFEVRRASKELIDFLDGYVVFVDDSTSETHKWRSELPKKVTETIDKIQAKRVLEHLQLLESMVYGESNKAVDNFILENNLNTKTAINIARNNDLNKLVHLLHRNTNGGDGSV